MTLVSMNIVLSYFNHIFFDNINRIRYLIARDKLKRQVLFPIDKWFVIIQTKCSSPTFNLILQSNNFCSIFLINDTINNRITKVVKKICVNRNPWQSYSRHYEKWRHERCQKEHCDCLKYFDCLAISRMRDILSCIFGWMMCLSCRNNVCFLMLTE